MFNVYYRHFATKELRQISVADEDCVLEARFHVLRHLKDIGDKASRPVLAVVQGGKV